MRQFIDLVESAHQWPETISGEDLAYEVQSQELHHTPEDWHEGDIEHNIASYGTYHLKRVPLSDLNLDLYTIDDDLVDQYANREGDAPPIIVAHQWGIITDGNHRANAARKRGDTDILAYVGDPDTYSPPSNDEDDDEWHPTEQW
jgi:hypothetical protein